MTLAMNDSQSKKSDVGNVQELESMNESGDHTLLVSVWMLAYNHEEYIAQAIQSILDQERDFALEIVIGDDCSTDNTQSIITAFQEQYPEIIRPIFRKQNVGIHRNFVETWFACKGKYIALLEGDDYWIDDRKLKTQVEFLEKNAHYSGCYQNAREINEITKKEKITNDKDRNAVDVKTLFERGWFIRTGSLVVRNGLLSEFPDLFFKYGSTDFILQLLIARHGPIKFLNEITSVYRRHEQGITQKFQSQQIQFNLKKVELLKELDVYFNFQYAKQIKRFIGNLYAHNTRILIGEKRVFKDPLLLISYFFKANKIAFLRFFKFKFFN